MIFNKEIKVADKVISSNSPCFLIAEAGVNHGGDIAVAKTLIDIASDSGVDAVKFQAFKTESLILNNVEKAPYQKNTTDSSESQTEMLKKLEINKEQNLELLDYCNQKGIIFLTTPFDEDSLDELDDIDLPAYKIASTDTTNLLFLEKVAKKNKPIFLSTGMSYLSEVQQAVETIYKFNQDLVIMHCTANYPIKDNEVNLNVLNTYKDNFDAILGYSDHSVGVGASIFSIPMGVKVLEKHFTISKELEGPDHLASLTPDELKKFVQEIRKVEEYMGSNIKKPNIVELNTRASLQKSFVARTEIKKGEDFTKENIIAKRTGGKGISAIYVNEILGKKSSRNYSEDDLIID